MIARARAPLRLGLAGGGTDVSPYCDRYGGVVLNATIDQYAYCSIEYSSDGKVHFLASDMDEHVTCGSESQISNECALELHRGVYNRMVREFNCDEPLAVRVTTSCDAPPGSGLGSSSTLVVAMVQAYSELLSLPLGEYDIASLAFEIERLDLGLKGGRQDHYAAAFGGFNFMEFNADNHALVNPLRVKSWIISELESSLVVFYTGRSRESASIIAEQSRNVESKNEAAIGAMHRTKEDAIRMKDCLLRGDIRRLGEVMEQAWQTKKEMASSISNSRIEHIYSVARDAGAYCGKVSGAGGGGFMMFLVDLKDRLRVVEALKSVREGIVLGCHFTANGAESWRLP